MAAITSPSRAMLKRILRRYTPLSILASCCQLIWWTMARSAPLLPGPLAGLTLPALLETLKPVFDEMDPEAEDRGFHSALAIARSFTDARINQIHAKLRAEGIVHQAIVSTGQGRVLELPIGMPFRPAIVKAGADHLLFVVHPREKDWCLTAIRRAEEGFELRADLPAAWAGLTNRDLEAACGVDGASFCHNGRFIAAAKTCEAAIAMAELAVREAMLQKSVPPSPRLTEPM